MHTILAEALDGWLVAAAAFFGGLAASILALGALVPARQRNRPLMLALAAPAFIVGVLVTLWIGYGFVTDGLHDPDYSMSDFAIPWLIMAGPSFATSLLAVVFFWLSAPKRTDA